jgi:hypothetical protein
MADPRIISIDLDERSLGWRSADVAEEMATLAFQNPAAATEPQQLPRNIEAEAALLGARSTRSSASRLSIIIAPSSAASASILRGSCCGSVGDDPRIGHPAGIVAKRVRRKSRADRLNAFSSGASPR